MLHPAPIHQIHDEFRGRGYGKEALASIMAICINGRLLEESPEAIRIKKFVWLARPGDNIEDFPGMDQEIRFESEDGFIDFGERFIVMPNPMYGSWYENPRD